MQETGKRPLKRGHEVEVTSLPQCDLCQKRLAQYDGRTIHGPWGYMCDVCFIIHGVGTGVGSGQRLVLASPA